MAPCRAAGVPCSSLHEEGLLESQHSPSSVIKSALPVRYDASACVRVQGMLCGDCLFARYGENVEEVAANKGGCAPAWHMHAFSQPTLATAGLLPAHSTPVHAGHQQLDAVQNM